VADWVDSLAKLLPVEKVYDDAVAPLAKQVGKFGGDTGRAARLVLFPIQGLAHLQDRLEAMFERIGRRVPEERQIEVRPEISAPAIEAMTYLDDKSELWQVLEEILTKATDSSTVGWVHPAFIHIAKQLSPDEIKILFNIEQPVEMVDTLELDATTGSWTNSGGRACRTGENANSLIENIPRTCNVAGRAGARGGLPSSDRAGFAGPSARSGPRRAAQRAPFAPPWQGKRRSRCETRGGLTTRMARWWRRRRLAASAR
jgi:hypothetical protein